MELGGVTFPAHKNKIKLLDPYNKPQNKAINNNNNNNLNDFNDKTLLLFGIQYIAIGAIFGIILVSILILIIFCCTKNYYGNTKHLLPEILWL